MSSLPQLFSLQDCTALVTGGTRGIGQAMALALAEAGARIVLVQRNETNQETKHAIEALGGSAAIVVADLSSPAAVAGVVPAAQAQTPAGRIDVLVNCGGIQRRHAAAAFPQDEWDAVLQVNLSAVFALSRDVGAAMLAQAPHPVTRRRGSIINVASLLSFQGGITVPAYAAAKGGVAQLTKALSNEWAGRGVSVNAIAPGYVATDMNTALINDPARADAILARIPAGRWGAPDDFKGAVVFLATAASAYVSGEILTVDGGWMGR